MIPLIAVEAVLWRPENEKMDVQIAIEELRQSSFIDVINKSGDDIINVPLAATLFGKAELEVYPEKIKVDADKKLLMEFGTTSYSNLSSGLVRNIERKFRAISNRISSVEQFEKELPILEYIASRYPKTYEYTIQVYEEYNDYEKVKYYVREYLKSNIVSSKKEVLWLKLADICKHTSDWDGESHALIELIQLPNVDLNKISDVANRINSHIYYNYDAKTNEYKRELLSIIIVVLKSKISQCNATDLSRLGWLLLNNNRPQEAEEVVKKGMSIDPNNSYCQRLLDKLEKTTR
jgi:tetratricopeptide (TPR) repeat protein